VEDAGPIYALEMQWSAYRLAAALVGRIKDDLIGALQPATAAALKAASAYYWAPQAFDAVAEAALALPDWACLSDEALGDLSPVGTCGWWWFSRPVPVQTISRANVPVVALLWRREHHPVQGPRMWLTTMVTEDEHLLSEVGRQRIVTADAYGKPVPTTSWLVLDGVRLDQWREEFRRGYEAVNPATVGYQRAGLDVTCDAGLWFSRFFIAACAWLRQRVVTRLPATGVRQAGRRLQREHRLEQPPKVEVVTLRRPALEAAQPRDPDAPHREFSCRWIVHGFWRNQYYPSTGRHAPKWIDSYIKGPVDKPLKEAARVFAVRR